MPGIVHTAGDLADQVGENHLYNGESSGRPLLWRHHIIASVRAEKRFGAERRPKGSTSSITVVPFHETAKSRWSERWTGTAL